MRLCLVFLNPLSLDFGSNFFLASILASFFGSRHFFDHAFCCLPLPGSYSTVHRQFSCLRLMPSGACEYSNKTARLLTPHGFRHTQASLLFKCAREQNVAGESIMKDVKYRLGYKGIKTTMNIYTHVTKDSANTTGEMFTKFMNF